MPKPAGNGHTTGKADPHADAAAGRYFLKLAFRRVRERFAALDDNDDVSCLTAAASTIGKF